jgi:class 3 adenylate cyclase
MSIKACRPKAQACYLAHLRRFLSKTFSSNIKPLAEGISLVMTNFLENSMSQMRVLVVDDSRTLRKVLARELQKMGIEQILEAEDGLAALEMLDKHTVDLMLLDMEMPELDGLGVLERIKDTDHLRHVPVIVISSAEELDKTVRCIEIGAEDYLPKTFNPVLFRARVFSSYEKKRLRDAEKSYLNQLQAEKEMLQIEQMKTERLMLNILPKPIADQLRDHEQTISSEYPDVTILFSDLVGFTRMASGLSPVALVSMLNDLFTRFDKRAKLLGLEKIKTIGDAYMAAAGLPVPRADHAEIAADMALGMFEDLELFNQKHGMTLDMRIGLNTGPVVAGVIGYTKFSYDLWGNTVNLASRMESTSIPGRVQISPTTQDALAGQFLFEPCGQVECKGIGPVNTHFLMGRLAS